MEAYKFIPPSNEVAFDNFNLNEEMGVEEEDEQIIKRARSYDCVFCRRGFTTAQALGGHMNVHRKDRVNHPKSSSRKLAYSSPHHDQEEDISQYHAQQSIYLANPYNTAGRTAIFFDGFRDDGWGMSLSLQAAAGGAGVGVGSHHVEIGGDGNSGGEDLDLELRLGHYPYW